MDFYGLPADDFIVVGNDGRAEKAKFKCELCSAEYTSKTSYQYHIRTHTGEKPFKCTECDYAAIAKFMLSQHMRTHTKEKPYQCAHCDYRAACASGLKSHSRRHTGEKPYVCKECNYRTPYASALRSHMSVHVETKNFQCSQCAYRGKSMQLLKWHQKRHSKSSQIKRFKCQYCPYSSHSKSVLKTHTRRHTGERPFSCDICEYKAISRTCLDAHIKTHKGIRPFKCKFCDYSATVSHVLQSHERLHTGERPYACEMCNERFISLNYLKNHIMTKHSDHAMNPYPCFICDERLETPEEWKEHSQQHITGVLHHKCSLCAYTTVRKTNLTLHMTMKHRLEKHVPWICTFCGKKYTAKTTFYRHLSMHKFSSRYEKIVFVKRITEAHEKALKSDSNTDSNVLGNGSCQEENDPPNENTVFVYGKTNSAPEPDNSEKMLIVDAKCDSEIIKDNQPEQMFLSDLATQKESNFELVNAPQIVRTLTITEDGELIEVETNCDFNLQTFNSPETVLQTV